jgi:hypothetical protein
MRLRTKIILGALAASLGGAWLASPAFIKWQVHKRYPEVTVGSARLGLGKVYLSDVSFERSWVGGTLRSVVVTWSGDVDITGGDVIVMVDDKPKPPAMTEPTRRNITYRDLVVKVEDEKHGADAELAGVHSGKGDEVCWTSLHVSTIGQYEAGSIPTIPPGTALTGPGCAARDGSSAHVDTVTFSVMEIPFVSPGVAQTAEGVTFDGPKREITAKRVALDLKDPVGEDFGVEATDASVDLLDTPLAHAGTLTVKHPMIKADPENRHHPLPVTFKDVVAKSGQVFDVKISGLQLHVNPSRETMEAWGEEPCQTWVDALPDGLRSPPLAGLQFEPDEFRFYVSVRPKVGIRLSNCHVKKDSCAGIQAIRQPFKYTVYNGGTAAERETGPGTPGWTRLIDAGPVPMAVVNTEDYSFRSHMGFIPQALENSLVADVEAGKFLRGGSTIEMQLAKNLWLDRTKTLGRKAEELFLAMALDSCLSKDDILETYVNVIEFGPGVYGVHDGAAYWFKKLPSELTPTEAFWLASILPHPEKAGEPTPDALRGAEALMRMLSKEGRIPMLADTVPDDTTGWVANQ